MAIKSVQFKSFQILDSKEIKNVAIVTRWTVKSGSGFFGKSYHIVVLKGTFLGFSNNSAYVTDKIPKKQNLSASTFHVDSDKNTEVLNDGSGNPICSYNSSDKVDLGFKIEDSQFAKTDALSEGLIKQLGDFLKNHLEAQQAARSKAGKQEAAPPSSKAPAAAAEEEEPKEKSKGLIRTSLSALSSRVSPLSFKVTALGSKAAPYATCDRIGFLVTSTAIVLYWLYLNGDVDSSIGSTL